MDGVKNREFTEFVRRKGRKHFRPMPWRADTRPYYVLVSELMLQQTQVSRVIPKFNDFIAKFPDEQNLAGSDLAAVLRAWQGLGYNRRAKYLHDAAKMIVNEFDGTFPREERDILRLPGVGKNTCGALRTYVFNDPSIFVETNIRTVYIHHFFADTLIVADKEIVAKLHETIDHEHPREFYWALMDYGSYLKAKGVRNNTKSKHYKKQPPLTGSIRETRGQIIKALSHGETTLDMLENGILYDDRFNIALDGLLRDGLIEYTNSKYHLTK